MKLAVLARLHQLVEDGYVFLYSLARQLIAAVKLGPLENDVLVYLEEVVKLRHHGAVLLSSLLSNVRGGQHVVGILPHAVEKHAHLAVFALFVKARSSAILFKSLLPLGPVVGLSEVEGLGRV